MKESVRRQRQKEEDEREKQRMRSALFDCRNGNYRWFSIVKTYVDTYGATALYNNYHVEVADYQKWLLNSRN